MTPHDEALAEEICRACGEPRSAHVATKKGPLTHPKEARGEGYYERSYRGFGLSCPYEKGGLCDLCLNNQGHETWVFIPLKEPR